MGPAPIIISESDARRLRGLIASQGDLQAADKETYRDLRGELERAAIVSTDELPPDVITMHSRFRLKDLDTGRIAEYELVYPGSSDITQGRISIAAPIGTALLGYRTLDTIEWTVPAGVKRFRIEEVLSQPKPSHADAA